MTPTLLDKWLLRMRDVPSPEHFKIIGFYYMIAAALQRRVWLGPPTMPMFPNMYVVICGETGVGKGNVIKPISHILKYHKLEGPEAAAAKSPDIVRIDETIAKHKAAGADESVIATLLQSREALLLAQTDSNEAHDPKKKLPKERYLIPVAPESTTFEALVQLNGSTVSKINVAPCEMAPTGFYAHHSMCFCLEEMSSLVRKKQEGVIQYLLCAYDCGDYDYKTKHQGEDRVRKCCVSLLAGTTPAFMKSSMSEGMLTEGFASRTLFTYGARVIKKFDIPPLTDEQKLAERDIIDRIKILGNKFGQVVYTPDALARLEQYYATEYERDFAACKDIIKDYYARKDSHIRKLSMAMHFADNDTYEIEIDIVERVLIFLRELEVTMHHALHFAGRNPLGALYEKIAKWIGKQSVAVSMVEIAYHFIEEMTPKEVEEAVVFLLAIDRLVVVPTNEGHKYRLK